MDGGHSQVILPFSLDSGLALARAGERAASGLAVDAAGGGSSLLSLAMVTFFPGQLEVLVLGVGPSSLRALASAHDPHDPTAANPVAPTGLPRFGTVAPTYRVAAVPAAMPDPKTADRDCKWSLSGGVIAYGM